MTPAVFHYSQATADGKEDAEGSEGIAGTASAVALEVHGVDMFHVFHNENSVVELKHIFAILEVWVCSEDTLELWVTVGHEPVPEGLQVKKRLPRLALPQDNVPKRLLWISFEKRERGRG